MTNKSIKLVRMKTAINAILADIKTKPHPADKIILFGSVAKDCIHERSDMDICIVSDEKLSIREQRGIENYFHDMSQGEFELDFTYCDNDKLQSGDRVFERIRQEGRVIYERV